MKQKTSLHWKIILQRLEDILKQVEQPEISLEQSFLLYQSGVEKLKECNVMLDTVEKKMQILNAKGELEDF